MGFAQKIPIGDTEGRCKVRKERTGKYPAFGGGWEAHTVSGAHTWVHPHTCRFKAAEKLLDISPNLLRACAGHRCFVHVPSQQSVTYPTYLVHLCLTPNTGTANPTALSVSPTAHACRS